MHIAFFIYSLSGGGAERVTTHMANHWSKTHRKVTVITMASTENNRYHLSAEIDLIALEIDGLSKGPISAIYNNISRINTLRKVLRNLNPDVVISMMTEANVMTGIACFGLKTKCIASERNFPGFDYTGCMWGLLRRHTYRFLDIVITQTDVGKKWISDNTSAGTVVSIPNPIVLPLLVNDPVVAVPKRTDRKRIIGTGRLTNQKQFHHLIAVFAKFSDEFKNWDLIILGEGENLAELQNLSKELGLQKRVNLPGRVGNIADWYLAADLFVMTSETEGFPNALIEAMAHGVAAISYDCPTGPSEIIESGVNGLLVKTNDKVELEKGIRELMNNNLKRKSFATAGKQITTTLNINSVMAQWDNVISDISASE